MFRKALTESVWLSLLAAATVTAGPSIHIIEESHYIQGHTNADVDSSSFFETNYPDDGTGVPLEDRCYGVWSSPGGDLRVDPAASARAGQFSVYTFAQGTLGEGMATFAHARSVYVFEPTSLELSLSYYAPSPTADLEGLARFLFQDLTEEVVLEQWTSDPESREGIDWFRTYAMNPLHEYELILECYSFGDHTTSGGLVNSLSVAIVPEPTTLLLLGIGLIGMRKKLKNSGALRDGVKRSS